MSEELRRVRDTLIEELRRSDTLTVAGRALFARYAAMCDPAAPAQNQEPEAAPQPPPPRPQPQVDDDEEFGGSFMVRTTTPPNIPGYRGTPTDLPRSIRDRRR
jgi:hypothetical protein